MLTPNILLALLMLLKPNPVALYLQLSEIETKATDADAVILDWANQKTPNIHMFVRPTPDQYEKAIDENKELLRAKIALDGSTTVEFYERPKDIDFYDSTIVLNRTGGPRRSYNVGNLIKHQALSLAHIGIVRSGDDTGMLICEYEGGAVGAIEGFAILRFSPDNIELHTLPLTDFGKVVSLKKNLNRLKFGRLCRTHLDRMLSRRHMPHRLVIGRRPGTSAILPSGSMAASRQQLSTSRE